MYRFVISNLESWDEWGIMVVGIPECTFYLFENLFPRLQKLRPGPCVRAQIYRLRKNSTPGRCFEVQGIVLKGHGKPQQGSIVRAILPSKYAGQTDLLGAPPLAARGRGYCLNYDWPGRPRQ